MKISLIVLLALVGCGKPTSNGSDILSDLNPSSGLCSGSKLVGVRNNVIIDTIVIGKADCSYVKISQPTNTTYYGSFKDHNSGSDEGEVTITIVRINTSGIDDHMLDHSTRLKYTLYEQSGEKYIYYTGAL